MTINMVAAILLYWSRYWRSNPKWDLWQQALHRMDVFAILPQLAVFFMLCFFGLLKPCMQYVWQMCRQQELGSIWAKWQHEIRAYCIFLLYCIQWEVQVGLADVPCKLSEEQYHSEGRLSAAGRGNVARYLKQTCPTFGRSGKSALSGHVISPQHAANMAVFIFWALDIFDSAHELITQGSKNKLKNVCGLPGYTSSRGTIVHANMDVACIFCLPHGCSHAIRTY